MDRMVEQREVVVKLLMWEICKRKKDAVKEFTRTVDYLRETIVEYKKLHREGSHIHNVEGTLAQIRRGPLGVVLCLGPFSFSFRMGGGSPKLFFPSPEVFSFPRNMFIFPKLFSFRQKYVPFPRNMFPFPRCVFPFPSCFSFSQKYVPFP